MPLGLLCNSYSLFLLSVATFGTIVKKTSAKCTGPGLSGCPYFSDSCSACSLSSSCRWTLERCQSTCSAPGCRCNQQLGFCLSGTGRNRYSCRGTPDPCEEIYSESRCLKNPECSWKPDYDSNSDGPSKSAFQGLVCPYFKIIEGCDNIVGREFSLVGGGNPPCGGASDEDFPVYRTIKSPYQDGSHDWFVHDKGPAGPRFSDWAIIVQSFTCQWTGLFPSNDPSLDVAAEWTSSSVDPTTDQGEIGCWTRLGDHIKYTERKSFRVQCSPDGSFQSPNDNAVVTPTRSPTSSPTRGPTDSPTVLVEPEADEDEYTRLRLDVGYDFWVKETTFVFSQGGATIYEGPEYNPEPYQARSTTFDAFPVGETTFTIYDSACDGMVSNFGNGSFSIYHLWGDTETLLASGGGNFECSQSVTFNATMTLEV